LDPIHVFLIPLQEIGTHLQEVGKEYGTTTGRRRRCGWLDLVALKHSCMINGYDSLNLTKLDILDDLPEIKVATRYVVDGKELPGFPGEIQPFHLLMFYSHLGSADLDVLAQVEVKYDTFGGWKTPIVSTKSFEELPDKCKEYITFIEKFLGVPIEWIGVGPGRDSMIQRRM
jgi:adenylosuccinate synthase